MALFVRSIYRIYRCTPNYLVTTQVYSFSSSGSDSDTDSSSSTPSSGSDSDDQAELNSDQQCVDAFLDSCLPFVPKYGWTDKTLIEGARSLDLPDAAHGLARDGPITLIHHFYAKANKNLFEQMTKRVESSTTKEPVVDFLNWAIKARLDMVIPYLGKWPEAMDVLLKDYTNYSKSMQLFSELIDDMWYMAGDRSHDINWYSKRLLLAQVYFTCQCFMLTDRSDKFEDTNKFIRKQLLESMARGARMGEFLRFASFGLSCLTIPPQLVKNFIGLNRF